MKEEKKLVPKLRFPEFRDAAGWEETRLQKIARPVSDRAVTGDGDNVLSLSGEHGLVLQSDYFGKKVAGDSAERYLKLVRNDFVYNDRTTKASVYGTIKRLSKYDGGIVRRYTNVSASSRRRTRSFGNGISSQVAMRLSWAA